MDFTTYSRKPAAFAPSNCSSPAGEVTDGALNAVHPAKEAGRAAGVPAERAVAPRHKTPAIRKRNRLMATYIRR
jgi:hypothetical protein